MKWHEMAVRSWTKIKAYLFHVGTREMATILLDGAVVQLLDVVALYAVSVVLVRLLRRCEDLARS